MASTALTKIRSDIRELIRDPNLDGWIVCERAMERLFRSKELDDHDVERLWKLAKELLYNEYKLAIGRQRTEAIQTTQAWGDDVRGSDPWNPHPRARKHGSPKWSGVVQAARGNPIFLARIMFIDGTIKRIGEMNRLDWEKYAEECATRAERQNRLAQGAQSVAAMFQNRDAMSATEDVLNPVIVQRTLADAGLKEALSLVA